MKKRTGILLFTLWIVLTLVDAQLAKAQSEPSLSGSKIKLEVVTATVDAVFVGEVTSIGFGDDKAKGESAYRGVQVKVLQVLRGTVDASATVTLHVAGRMDFHENPPKVGSSYIFFVKRNDKKDHDQFTALKLLLASDNNITRVKALNTAAPAAK